MSKVKTREAESLVERVLTYLRALVAIQVMWREFRIQHPDDQRAQALKSRKGFVKSFCLAGGWGYVNTLPARLAQKDRAGRYLHGSLCAELGTTPEFCETLAKPLALRMPAEAGGDITAASLLMAEATAQALDVLRAEGTVTIKSGSPLADLFAAKLADYVSGTNPKDGLVAAEGLTDTWIKLAADGTAKTRAPRELGSI